MSRHRRPDPPAELPPGARSLGIRVPDPARKIGVIFRCGDCGSEQPRRGAMQLYCEACSAVRARARRDKWIEKNPVGNKAAKAKYGHKYLSTVNQQGIDNSELSRWSLDSVFPDETGMAWVRRVAFPFHPALSKNFIYRYTADGHVYLRRETVRVREQLSSSIREAVADVRVATNKVWLAIVVQKPDHKSDAINVLDSVADAAKKGVGVDDRWFCVRQVDWQITKTHPMIFIGIGQESVVDLHACSSCGRLLPYEMFWKNKCNKIGLHRNCRDCMRVKKRSID